MDHLLEILNKVIEDNLFIQGVLSNVKKGVEKSFTKVTISPFLNKDEIKYQITYVYEKKVTHKNVDSAELVEEINQLLSGYFKNAVFFTTIKDYHVLISKKGSMKVLEKQPTKKQEEVSTHNRKKKYIIEEGENCDFLKYLGVMSSNNKVHAKKYDKFKQINKFLEIVENSLSYLDKSKTVSIIDFGCGKAYLTFALYYYLVKKNGYKVDIIGLDLKEDVIDYCNEVARELQYTGLKFLKGDIKEYNEKEKVDMVITLHACDTATDAALIKAVNWNAKVILSVPCCQHELFNQIDNNVMVPMLRHGLIKERLSSLITDTMRTQILEIKGYDVSVIEFVALEHTPRNLMIKAVYTGKENKIVEEEYKAFKEFWNINPYIDQQLLI